MPEISEQLFADAKNYLDITWEDPGSDKKLSGILLRGMSYLTDRAGVELDFEDEGEAKALLFDYCRYARANALDEFEKNYLHELLNLHIKGVASRVEEESAG